MSSACTCQPEHADKRDTSDRRMRPTPILSRYTFMGGRRRTIRRGADRGRHIFVDLYSTRLLLIVVALLLLSCADAFLTITLIYTGIAVEANPLMASALSYGILPFTVIKFSITAFALLVLCVFKNVRITRFTLPLAVKIYVGIIIYELYLFMI